MKRVMLKISGEALGGKDKTIDMNTVNAMAKEIKQLHDLGDIAIGIVCGAGNIWRGRDAIDNGMDRTSADYMGMLGTIMNCCALQSALEKLGLETRVLTALTLCIAFFALISGITIQISMMRYNDEDNNDYYDDINNKKESSLLKKQNPKTNDSKSKNPQITRLSELQEFN